MNEKLLIIGAGGHGKVIADIAMKMNRWKSISFADDAYINQTIMGIDVIGNTNDAFELTSEYDIIVGIGNNMVRQQLQSRLERAHASIPTLIHPNAVVAADVFVDAGSVVMAGVVINCGTRIGKGCIINTGATIDHDNVIEDFVHVSPGAHLAGSVNVGKGTWLGIGSVVSHNVMIAPNCTIGAGAVVVHDIDRSGVYIGVPAKFLR